MAALAQGALALLGGAASIARSNSNGSSSSSSSSTVSSSGRSSSSVARAARARVSPFTRVGGDLVSARSRSRIRSGAAYSSGSSRRGGGVATFAASSSQPPKQPKPGSSSSSSSGGGNSNNSSSSGSGSGSGSRSVGPGDPLFNAYRAGVARSASYVMASTAGDDGDARPLAINQDLLVYQARQMRNNALKMRLKDERKKMRLNAIRVFERAKAVDPADGRAYVGIGQLLQQLGDVDAARQNFQDGCDATGGDNAYIWQAWATLEERAGDVPRARQLYDAATAADKSHAAAWHGWGMLEKSQGNFQRARDLLVKGVRLVPPSRASPHLYQSLGVMAAERGRVQEAREHFKEGTKTEAGAQSAALWQAWGMLESRQGNGDQARKLFQRGLQADPQNRFVWLSWAVFEAKEGFVDRARGLLIKGCKLNPRDPPLLQALARLEAVEGNMEVARRLFEQGTKLAPGHQANWQAWAMAEWKAGSVDRARELFQRGVWVAPRSRNACRLFQAWGVLEEREGNVPLARQLYKCAVKSDPSSEKTWLTWADMEQGLGNDIRAGELRNLCVQQRAEEAVGSSDLSPAAMFGIDSALRPILRSLATLLGNQGGMPPLEGMGGNSVGYGEMGTSDRDVVGSEPLYGVVGSSEEFL